MYPSGCQNKREPKTDITITKNNQDQLDHSQTLSDFDGENLREKSEKVTQIEVIGQGFPFTTE